MDADLRACEDDERLFLHEPRALWTVQSIQAPSGASSALNGRVTVDKDHFRNGSRYPITLTKLLLSTIGYTFREYAPDVEQHTLATVQNSMSVLNLLDVFISAPYSLHLSKNDLRASSLPACGVSEPSMRYYLSTPFASGAWGLCRWDFDRILWLPRKATLQLDLGAYALPDISFGPKEWTAAVLPRTSVCFDEWHTGMMGGNNRLRQRAALPDATETLTDNDPNIVIDAFGPFAGTNAASATPWPPNGLFQPKDFDEQESDRGQEMSAYRGFAAMIDQIDYDAFIQGLGDQYAGQPVAPLSTRVPTRARTTHGGSGEWWWRPGAPLCLVSPTIGPALVFDLPNPIVLGPGEQLELEIQVPNGIVVGGQLWQPTYNLGVSFTGYASIEGP